VQQQIPSALKKADEAQIDQAEAVEEEKEKNKEALAIDLLQRLQEGYDTAVSYMKANSVKKGENNWFKHCGSIMYKLMTEEGMNREELLFFLVEHMIEHLLFEEKLALMNFLSKKRVLDEMTQVESASKIYIEENTLHDNRLSGIILYNGQIRHMMILDEKESQWKEAEPEDERDLKTAISKKYKMNADDLNEQVGFIGPEQKNKYLVFKVKNVKAKRTTGARCDQATKAKSLVILNSIIGEEKYTKENTKTIVDTGICIMEEFILRKYNKERKNGKIWFLTPEAALIYKI